MEEVVLGAFHDMNSDLPQHLFTGALSVWPTVAPPKIIHGEGCLEYQKQSAAAVARTFDHYVSAQELPSAGSAGVWRFGSTL